MEGFSNKSSHQGRTTDEGSESSDSDQGKSKSLAIAAGIDGVLVPRQTSIASRLIVIIHTRWLSFILCCLKSCGRWVTQSHQSLLIRNRSIILKKLEEDSATLTNWEGGEECKGDVGSGRTID